MQLSYPFYELYYRMAVAIMIMNGAEAHYRKPQ